MIVVYGGVRVFNAVTEAKARKGAPIRDPARWVRGALVQGWEIPDHWAMETARREREGIVLDDTTCSALAAVLADLGLPDALPCVAPRDGAGSRRRHTP